MRSLTDLVTSKRSLLLLDLLLLDSRVTERVVDRSVGVRVVLSTSDDKSAILFLFLNIPRLRSRDGHLLVT